MAMDKYNLRDLQDTRQSLLKKAGGARTKIAEVRLFGDFGAGGVLHECVGGGEVVKDPYYGGANGFEEVYQQVTRFSRGFLDYLEKGNASKE